MSPICYLSGVGFQEVILLLLFLGLLVALPVFVIIFIVNRFRSPQINSIAGSTLDRTPSLILNNAGKLKELKSLQDQGVISREEFEREKAKILAEG